MYDRRSIAYVIAHRRRARALALDALIVRLETLLQRFADMLARWQVLTTESTEGARHG